MGGMKGPSRRFAAAVALASIALLPLALTGETPEWPCFRGPQGNPVSTNRLPDTWSKTENVEWKTPIPGRGWSSPIVSGNRVFVTAATTDGESKTPQVGTQYSNEYAAELQKQGLSPKEINARVTERDFELPEEVTLHSFLYCLDLKTGKLNWKQEYHAGRPPGGRHRKNSFTSETPVTDGRLVYVYGTSIGLWAYDMKGGLVWKTPHENYPMYGNFGTGASPALAGHLLVIVHDNEKRQFIAAFDKKTGRQVWRTDRDLKAGTSPAARRSGWSTPYVWTTPGRTELVTIGPGFAVSYDLQGKELWRLPGMGGGPIPSPYAWDGLLYLNGGSGGAMAAVKPGATGTLSPGEGGTPNEFVAWSVARAGTYLPTQLAYGGALYSVTDTGILSRYDAKTGALGYRSRIENGVAFTASPWASDGKVFCLNEEGKTFVIAAGEKYELLKVNDLEEFALATPALVGDRLLLRTESLLYSIRQKRR
jgi:outer membrane protein assembly factor BamB